jgi:hypothetical protein
LGFTADAATRGALKGWNPFDNRTPQRAEILLGLLMGLCGRGDLLDRYTFAEFFCVWPHIQIMIGTSGAKNWVGRLTRSMDQRINKIGALTRKELQLFKDYKSIYDDYFSAEAERIISTSTSYCELSDKFSLFESIALNNKQKNLIKDELNKIMNRFNASREDNFENLSLCTSTVSPDFGSIYRLPQRQQVAEESQSLLLAELGAAHDLFARVE